MKQIKSIITILSLYLICSNIVGQELHFIKHNNLTNLPSNECYNIIQDLQGYIWFSTDRGLCKFNGEELKIFSSQNGLPEESCYGLTVDQKGKIWVFTSNNRLLFIENDSVIEHPLSPTISKELNKDLMLATYFKTEDDSIIWVGTQSSTYKINYKKNKFTRVNNWLSDKSMVFVQKKAILVPVQHDVNKKSHRAKLASKKIEFSVIKNLDTKNYTVKYPNNFSATYRILSCITKSGELIISFTNQLIKINKNNELEVKTLGGDILSLYNDKNNDLWVGTRKSGVYYIKKSDIYSSKIVKGLSQLSVSGILTDEQNSIWCSTIEDGIYYCQNISVLQYSNIILKPILFSKNVGNELLIVTDTNEITLLNSVNSKKLHTRNLNLSNITDVIKINQKLLISSKNFVCNVDSSFQDINYCYLKGYDNKILNYGNNLVELNFRYFGCNTCQITEYVNGETLEIETNFPETIKGIQSYGESDLLVWSKTSLYTFNVKSKDRKKITEINRISKITISKDSSIWITTVKQGIYRLKGKTLNSIKVPVGFENLVFHDLAEDKNNSIWFATNKGVLMLKAPVDSNEFIFFTQNEGFPFSDCKSIQLLNDQVYINCNQKLYSMDCGIAKTSNYFPGLFVKQILVNNNAIKLINDKYTLNHNENNIKIDVEFLDYHQQEHKNKIAYKFEGIDSTYTLSSDKSIIFNKLNPGEYKIKILPIYNGQLVTSKAITILIYISKPIWASYPLLILYILLIFLLLNFFIRAYITKIKTKEAVKSEQLQLIADYKMAAIRAQMNPHFIFNCINSIQRYILTSDTKGAYTYLSDFAKLIRLVLDYSEENLISFRQELEVVSLYVKMEQLRYDHSFEFIITNEVNIDPEDYELPPMMLQPYIENSIWHGIMHLEKKRRGIIRLNYNVHDNNLCITIEDNGVGRKMASAFTQKTHKSKAIDLNNRRVETINQINSNKVDRINIEDVLDSDKKTVGTKVIIVISQQIEYERA